MTKKIILITGVSGFLGMALAKSLISKGYIIIGFTRDLKKMQDTNKKDLIYYENSTQNLHKAFDEYPDICGVIHTATCYGRNGESVVEIMEANVLYPLSFLEIATKKNIRFFINTDTVLQKYLNLYSMSKNQFLEWGRFFSNQGFMKFINIKLQHMYGPGDDISKFTAYLFHKLMDNADEILLTPGDQARDFIYITDVVKAYIIVLENISDFSNFDELEVGTGNPITLKNFTLLSKKIFESSSHLKFGEIPYRKGEVMTSSCNSPKLRSMGWAPEVSLDDGLKLTKKGYNL